VADSIEFPDPCLVVLVGPSGSGKSTWALQHFRPEQVVSSDRLRAIVGEDERDQLASSDAFELLELIVKRRLHRRLTTVIDTVGLDDERRRGYREAAASAGLPAFVVAFDTPGDVCRARNRERRRPIPERVLNGQIRRFGQIRPRLAEEGWEGVLAPATVALAAAPFRQAAAALTRQQSRPIGLRFGLSVSTFGWGRESTRTELVRLAGIAEGVGFDSLWLMDHLIQIPQVGPEWADLLESYTTLGYLAACTERVTLGALVTAVTFRNVGHLAKIVATLDVLSGGRAWCGLGAAWWAREHQAYGFTFPPPRERLDILEDALQVLPLLWGPGSKSFAGRVLNLPDTLCYPRPLQDRVPILVGGQGELRTLRLAARYADACNLFGDAERVAAKRAVLHRHCAAVGRDPASIEVTHLSPVLVGENVSHVDALVASLRPRSESSERFRARTKAGTVDQQVGRLRLLAEAGVQHAIVSLPNLTDESALPTFGKVITAFR